MMKKFEFDYDLENDGLFIYNPKTKSKASVEIDDLIIDYDSKKQISAIELLNASKFFKDLNEFEITKETLKEIIECKLEIIPKNNFFMIKFLFLLKTKEELITPVIIPNIHESSPAIKA